MKKEELDRLRDHLKPSGALRGAYDVAFTLQGLGVDKLLAEREALLEFVRRLALDYPKCALCNESGELVRRIES